MYPLNLLKAASGVIAAGFAVANDENEHILLTAHGFLPAHVAPHEVDADERAEVMAALDKAEIQFDRRLGLAKLKALLPA